MGARRVIMVFAVLLAMLSCQKEIAGGPVVQQDDSALNPEAGLFYSNISKIIRACLDSPLAQLAEYPFFEKLATIDIELEDGSTTVFAELPAEQKIVFVDMLMSYQASQLSQKIKLVPELEQYVVARNGIVSGALAGILTRAGEPVIDDPAAFMENLGGQLDELASGFSYEFPQTRTDPVWEELEYDRLFSLLCGTAKRGDIIVALPWHGHSWCVVNPFREIGHFGHSEVFTKDITATTTDTEYTSIGVRKDRGVVYQPLTSWRRKSYLLEVCDYRIKWTWDGWNSGFEVIQTPVEGAAEIATWAEKYEGCQYSRWYEMIAPKWFAPERFTCTSLIWWCVKNACGIRISPWLSTLVSPSDVLCDFNTRLKVVVEP